MRRRSDRTALPVALAVSATLHGVILSLRFDARGPAREMATSRQPSFEWRPITRVVDIVLLGGVEPTRTVNDVLRPLRVVSDASDAAGSPGSASGVAPASVAERLAPHALDPRLVEQPRERLAPDRAPLDVARARIQTQLDPYNDSIAAEAAAAKRASDWTLTDADGGRWGFSPHAIHLGKTTLSPCRAPLDPVTCPFRIEFARGNEHNERLRTFHDIWQQAARVEARTIIEQRARAMRARAAAVRDSLNLPTWRKR